MSSSRRDFNKLMIGAIGASFVPSAEADDIQPKQPAQTRIYQHTNSFCSQVAIMAEGYLDELSAARRLLVRDHLPQAVAPSYSTSDRYGSPYTISRQQDRSLQPVPRYENGKTIAEPFEETYPIYDKIDPKIIKLHNKHPKRHLIAHLLAYKQALHFASREDTHLVSLLEKVSDTHQKFNLAINQLSSKGYHPDVIVYHPNNHKLLETSINSVIREENSCVRIWEWRYLHRKTDEAVSVQVGPPTQQFRIGGYLMVPVADKRLRDRCYLCDSGSSLGAIAIRQNVTVLPFSNGTKMISYYEPAFMAEPGAAATVMLT